MSKIVIGTHAGKNVSFDLDLLLATRLLVQAGSGGGKSWLLRRLMEQAFGKVQIICIDPEGEFSTLREKYDYVLAGKGGEATVDPRAAGLLAERLLQIKASAVCDIYELKSHQRHSFVKTFLEALINAPKDLWHPVLVIVDEAHVFCPEKGQGESEAYGSMVDLATRGRKRGFAAIFATQRLGKLSKNASAELTNRLIGPTFEDVDRKRAIELLGIAKADEREFSRELQVSNPGQFHALGRAISLERIQVEIGPVLTSHPEVGKGKIQQHQPPTPDAIKDLLPQLADLPKEAEEKARTTAELRQEITNLKRELTNARKVAPEADPRAIESAVALALNKQASDFNMRALPLQRDNARLRDGLQRMAQIIEAVGNVPAPKIETAPKLDVPVAPRRIEPRKYESRPVSSNGHGEKLPPGEKAVLIAAAQYQDGVERDQLSVLTGYKRSSRDAYIARLIQRGYVELTGSALAATETGITALGSDYEPLPSGEELQEYWRNRLPEGEKRVLEILINNHPQAVARELIDEKTGYKRSSRDAYLARLTSRRLVESVGRGEVKASETLF